jgi:hypothetical protein
LLIFQHCVKLGTGSESRSGSASNGKRRIRIKTSGDPQITEFEREEFIERLNPLFQTRGDKWDGPSCTEFYIHSNQHEARKYYYHAQYLKMD